MHRLRRLISAITFVGVVFHEFGHKLFCDITGVKVYRVCYFRIGNPAGYVIHDRPRNFTQSFLIVAGAFITGTFLALLFFYIAENQVAEMWGALFFNWLGVSAAINSFPSDTDGKNLWKFTNRLVLRNPLVAVGYLFALFIWLANSLIVIWFDLIYALLLYQFVNSVTV